MHPKNVSVGKECVVNTRGRRQEGRIVAILSNPPITLQSRVQVELDGGNTIERTVANLLEP